MICLRESFARVSYHGQLHMRLEEELSFHVTILPYFFGYKMDYFFLPKQSQRSRSVLKDGSRSLGLFRKGKIGIILKFHRTDLVI